MRYSKIFQDGLIIAVMKSKWILRSFGGFLTLIVFPILLSLVAIFVLRIANVTYTFSAVVIFFTAISAITVISQGMASDERSRTLAIFITLPIHPFSYALGIALNSLILNSSGLLILIPFYYLLSLFTGEIPITSLIFLFIVSLPGWLTCLSVGFLIGVYTLEKEWIYNFTSILSMIFTFANPLFIPMENFPPVFQYLIYLVPTTPLALLLKAMITGSPLVNILTNLLMSITYAMIAFILAIRRIRWGLG